MMDVCTMKNWEKYKKSRFNSKIGNVLANFETVYINRIIELADIFYDIGN
jgi:hypothetical protein